MARHIYTLVEKSCSFLIVLLALSGSGLGANPLFTSALASPQRVSIVTGANGYVGREVVHVLLEDTDADTPQSIYCLVRPNRIDSEKSYWKSQSAADCVQVLPYDMLDGGNCVTQALKKATPDGENVCVYHIASVFGPSEDPVQTAMDNVKGTEDLVKAVAKFPNCRLVLTSSMAAVRGPGQEPLNGKFYTYNDWNTVSELGLGENWGACYQWSKAESERRAWELAKQLDVPMSSICPSFVFGPPKSDGTNQLSKSFSITLVGQWVRGESPVQSRLCVDIRDVARAHVAAGTRPEAMGQRLLLSTESRVPSLNMAEALKQICRETGLGDADKITHDAEFQGGAIPIGGQEVEATERFQTILGITLRPVEETIYDMGRALLQAAAVQETTK
jgi:nucleoside-diphosphate-sugar epimerase